MRQVEFARELARALHRPAVLPAPEPFVPMSVLANGVVRNGVIYRCILPVEDPASHAADLVRDLAAAR